MKTRYVYILAILLVGCGGGGGEEVDSGPTSDSATPAVQAPNQGAQPPPAAIPQAGTPVPAPPPSSAPTPDVNLVFTPQAAAPAACTVWATQNHLLDGRPADPNGNPVSKIYCFPSLNNGIINPGCACVG